MSLFSRIVQPPAYLRLPSFGLDISEESFKYIQFTETQNGLRLGRFGTESLPKGLLHNGIIDDAPTLAKILKARLSDMPRYVAVALPEEQGFIRSIRMPQMAEEDLREAIFLQLEEHIPLPPEDTSFAYTPLSSRTPETMDILIAAFPTPLLLDYKKTVEDAGFTPVLLEIESQAISRAVVPAREPADSTFLIIDIGRNRTTFLFAKNGLAQRTSTIPIGGTILHTAISKALGVNEKEAERLKMKHGLSNTKEGKEIFEALLQPVQIIKDEMQKYITFWEKEAEQQKSAASIQHAYLCGREANLIGLSSHLARQIDTPVTQANVWANTVTDMSYISEIEFRDSLGYATSIGLALGAKHV